MAALARRLLISITLFWLAWGALAADRAVPNLYQFEVPVADAGGDTRRAAQREAMEQVLIRLTGDRKLAQRPQAQALLQRADGFIQQYAYAQRPLEAAEGDEPAEAPATRLVLQGRFVAQALDTAIRKAGLPLWSARRPQILALIVLQSEQGAVLLDNRSVAAYPELTGAARERGQPLRFPPSGSLDAAQLMTPDSPMLLMAANNAGADYVLWARLEEGAGQWVLQAQLNQAETSMQNWRLRSREPGPLLREALHRSTDILAQQLALAAYTPGGESIVGLWVHGVGSGLDYMHVQQHLAGLPTVEQLSLVAVVEGALVFRASTEAAAEQLDRSIRQAGRLSSAQMPFGAAAAPVWTGEYEYHYRLQ